jgi:ppGpp synthetase/RelA/SpoT-type nucleotidyltranferase
MPHNKKQESLASLPELESQYKAVSPLAERFAEELKHQLEHLLIDASISLSFPIQQRVKAWSSIAEKFERKSLQLRELKQLNDLVGLRLILQFRRDIATVSGLIDKHFRVIEKYDTVERLKEDQFGYSSTHFVIELPESWLAVPTLSSLKGLRAELQVRTTAQHIWAAASHTLQYKQEESVPLPIRRAIHRVSALLETVDLEFERVLEQRAAYRQEVSIEQSPAPLNVDLLEKLLDSQWPLENKAPDEDYAELLRDLLAFEIGTSKTLLDLIIKHRSSVLQHDKEQAEREMKEQREKPLPGTSPERIERGVFFTHGGLTREALSEEFGRAWLKYMEVVY